MEELVQKGILIKTDKGVFPFFVPYNSDFFPPEGDIIEEYTFDGTKVKIIKRKNFERLFYFIDPPEFHLSLKEAEEIAKAFETGKISENLKDIFERYSKGLGIFELIGRDRNIEDIFLNSIDGSVSVIHKKYGLMDTNIRLNKKDIARINIRLRELSGRPFDEGIPVIHLALGRMRITGVREPFTFRNVGYAIRIHERQSWTLPKLISMKMLDEKVGALLSLLVDSFSTILITGPRGAGKTSLLSALLFEIPKTERTIIIEDTPELPVEEMVKCGYVVEHIRVSAWESEYEMTPEEALRASLRLGESFLIIGEVRGKEAITLFEAMRVGAAGNTVMGTIHGSSAEDVFDRIVNEIGIPKTSFKATDFIVSVNQLRLGESLKKIRRLIEVKEVKKDWINDPRLENGFLEIVNYDRFKDRWSIKNLEKSFGISRILFKRGWKFEDLKEVLKVKEEFLKRCIKKKIFDPENYSRLKSRYYYLIEEGYSPEEALKKTFKGR